MDTITETGDLYCAFKGLPVINNHGKVVFRADLVNGGQGIYTWDKGAFKTIADTDEIYSDMGNFPIFNDKGIVAFNATLKSGLHGIFTITDDGQTTTIVDSDGPFESFRGLLINNSGRVIFYATPTGGELGIYNGLDPIANKLLSIGQPAFRSTIAEFALNPVSINDAGQIAIRVMLADDRQFILRADPVR